MIEKRSFFFSERGLGRGSSSERQIDKRCLYRVIEKRLFSERELLKERSSLKKLIDKRCPVQRMVEERLLLKKE
jgi:hypothetical protein